MCSPHSCSYTHKGARWRGQTLSWHQQLARVTDPDPHPTAHRAERKCRNKQGSPVTHAHGAEQQMGQGLFLHLPACSGAPSSAQHLGWLTW